MSTFITELFLIAALGLSLWRLPPLHPVTLWCASWAVTGFLFSLDLFPYKPLSSATALLICGGTAAFAVGALAGERLAPRWSMRFKSTKRSKAGESREVKAIQRAALSAAAIGAVALLAFLGEQVRTFGVSDTLLVSREARLGLGTGASALSIKYLWAMIAAAALASLAAAWQPTRNSRYAWLGLASACIASIYFSTGRATILFGATVATFAFALGRPRLPRLRNIIAGAAVLAMLAVGALVVIGEIQGKTYENSALPGLPSAFSENQSIEPLALPYEYASASFGALNEQVEVATTWGESHGCATGYAVCSALELVGVGGAEARPLIRPFTAYPLAWNLYTALDLPLLDGGFALALPILAVAGMAFGALWAGVKLRRTTVALVYSIAGPTLLFSGTTFGFVAPHVLGAILIAVGLVLAWQFWASYAGRRAGRRAGAVPQRS